ncbi:hypothetical protein GCM10011329_14020 [Stakelama pacifica]|nr:hypothetical protein GCM10011329_14020 [Stakelama pacifica]
MDATRETPEGGAAMTGIAGSDLIAIFAGLGPARHFTGAAATDPETQAAAMIDLVIENVAAAGAQGVRFASHDDRMAVEAILPGARRHRLLTADGALGSAMAARLAEMRKADVQNMEWISADGDVVALLFFSSPDAAAPAGEIEGIPPQFVSRVIRAIEQHTGLVLVADPDPKGRAATIAAIGDYHRRAGRAVLSIDTLRRDRHLSLAGAIGRAEHVLPDILLIETIDGAEAIRAAVVAAVDRLVVAGVSSHDAMSAMSIVALRKTDRFDFASVIRAVVGQRSLRRLCGACKARAQASRSESALLGFDAGTMIYRAAGCAQCHGEGYSGEVRAVEVVEADAALRRLIGGGGDAAILARHAFLKSPNLGAAARELVRDGETAPDEAIRISRGNPVAA